MNNIQPGGTGRADEFSSVGNLDDKAGTYKDKKVTGANAILSRSENDELLPGKKICDRNGNAVPAQMRLHNHETKDGQPLSEKSVEELNDIASELINNVRDGQKKIMLDSVEEALKSLRRALSDRKGNGKGVETIRRDLVELSLPAGICVEVMGSENAIISIIPPDTNLTYYTTNELSFYCELCLGIVDKERNMINPEGFDKNQVIGIPKSRLQDINNIIAKKGGEPVISENDLKHIGSESCSHSVNLSGDEVRQMVPKKYKKFAKECMVKLEHHVHKRNVIREPDLHKNIVRNKSKKGDVEHNNKKGNLNRRLSDRKKSSKAKKPKENGYVIDLEARMQAFEAENQQLKARLSESQLRDGDLEIFNKKYQSISDLNVKQKERINDLEMDKHNLIEGYGQLKKVNEQNMEEVYALETKLAEDDVNHKDVEEYNKLEKINKQNMEKINEMEGLLAKESETSHKAIEEKSELEKINKQNMEKLNDMGNLLEKESEVSRKVIEENSKLEEINKQNIEKINEMKNRLAEGGMSHKDVEEYNKLKEINKQDAGRINALENMLEKERKANSKIIEENKVLENNNNYNTGKVNELNGVLDEEFEVNRKAKEENDVLEEINNKHADEIKALQQELIKEKTDKQDIVEQNNILKKISEDEVGDANISIELKKELQKQKHDNNNLSQERNALINKNNEIDKANKILTNKVKDMESKDLELNKVAESREEGYKEDINKLTALVRDGSKSNDEMKLVLQTQKQDNALLDKKINELSDNNKHVLEENRGLKDQVASMKMNQEKAPEIAGKLKAEHQKEMNELKELNEKILKGNVKANADLRKKGEDNSKLNEKISDLDNNNKVVVAENSKLNGKIKGMESKEKNLHKEYEILKGEFEKISSAGHTKEDFGKLQRDNRYLVKQHKVMSDKLSAMAEEKDNHVHSSKSKISYLEDQNKQLKENLNNIKGNPAATDASHDGENYNLQDLVSKLRDENDTLKSDLDDLKNRLSKKASDKMHDNNPSITDLSNTHRPAKVGEKYLSMYDDGWTDAMEVLDNKCEVSEMDGCVFLRDIMYSAKAKAKDVVNKYRENLFEMIGEKNGLKDLDPSVSMYLKKAISNKFSEPDILKENASIIVKSIKTSYVDKSGNTADLEEFANSIAELCIFMEIQDPPMVLSPIAEHGSDMDDNLYRTYSKSGNKVDFTVWPCLLLHEGGAVIFKGVVQPFKK